MDIQAQRKQRLAKLLKSKRDELGLSQRAAAAHLGFRQATIQQWESAKTEPDVASLERIAPFLGYTMEELWTYLDTGKARSLEKWDLNKILSILDTMPRKDKALLANALIKDLAEVS